MRFPHVRTAALTFAFLASSTSAAPGKGIPKEWQQCKVDSDCVHIEYSCTQAVVNKKYARPADEYLGHENSILDCVQMPPSEKQKQDPYKIFCESKQCKVRGVNPKSPKFS